MAKRVSAENRDKIVRLGLAIATVRKVRGMTQAQLAEWVGVSRDTVQGIESPSVLRSFSFETFLKIAYVLEVDPCALLRGDIFSGDILWVER